MLLDAAALVRAARERAGLTQAELADRAGTARTAVGRYERGQLSPSARTLARLLAAAGFQARCTLEPLLAELDERVDAFVAATPEVSVSTLERLAGSFAAADPGPVSWALDGKTALACQGLGGGAGFVEWIVLRFDDAAKHWMFRQLVRGTGAAPPVGWWSSTPEEANAYLGEAATSLTGMYRIRVVEDLPALLEVRPPGGELPLPTLTVDAVEQAHPALREVLERWRARRAA